MRVSVSKSEINAVVKILDDDKWEKEEATSQDVASAIIEKLDSLREGKQKYVMVARIHLPDQQWANFAVGPFNTLLQAQRAGEPFTHDPKSRTGEGAYRAVPIVNKASDAYDMIRAEQVYHKDWIIEQIATGMTGLSDPDVYKDRGKW